MYDLIGDIHGHAGALERLLHKMGYAETGGVYAHPGRQVIFLGDYIDRGTQNRRVLEIVMRMVESGHAIALMGNHEYNSILYHTEDPGNPGEYLRPRIDKNVHQHKAFLREFDEDVKTRERVLAWFRSLPIFLDLPDLRVVHACWSDRHMQTLLPNLDAGRITDESFWHKSSRKDTVEYRAIDCLLKGPELKLPGGISYQDKDGIERSDARVKWWEQDPQTLEETVIFPQGVNLPAAVSIGSQRWEFGYPDNAKPVFFGHYWWFGEPRPIRNNISCLDYSVAKGDKLVAYRWLGERDLDPARYVSVPALEL